MGVLPGEVWQYPMIAGMLLVVGWLLWNGREERRRVGVERVAEGKRVAEERAVEAVEIKEEREAREKRGREERDRYIGSMEEMVRQAEEDRRAHFVSWQEMVTQTIAVQSAVCKAIEDHEVMSERRHGEMLARMREA